MLCLLNFFCFSETRHASRVLNIPVEYEKWNSARSDSGAMHRWINEEELQDIMGENYQVKLDQDELVPGMMQDIVHVQITSA